MSLVPGLAPSASAAPAPAPGAESDAVWTASSARVDSSSAGNKRRVNPARYEAYTLDQGTLEARLDRAPSEDRASRGAQGATITVPGPDGNLQRFEIVDSPVMQAGLAAAHPEISTYAGRGIDVPTASIRLDVTPVGFHASVRDLRSGVSWYVDPAYNNDDSLYLSYFGADLPLDEKPLVEPELGEETHREIVASAGEQPGAAVGRRTYRLALLTDPAYARYFGTQSVLSEKVVLMNRVNQIYNDDLAIRMVLIDGTDKLNLDTDAKAFGVDGPCGSAGCYTGAPQLASGCTSALLSRTRLAIGQLVGADTYDIGHIMLGTNGGGVASLGVVGGDRKAQGCTGLPQPEGDYMAIDYVAHEMGHQFSGNHTFNGTQHSCGGNKAAPSVEPGSGSSVMAYAGICRSDDLQPHTDPYFSQWTQQEVTAFITNPRPSAGGCSSLITDSCRVNEVQNVALRGFDTDGESFTLTVNGVTTEPIVRGTNYTVAAIDAAIEAALGQATSVTTAPYFGGMADTFGDAGFQVSFNGLPLAGNDAPVIVVNPVTGDLTSTVGTTAQGGPIKNMGWEIESLGNHAPAVTAPAGKTIPMRTPFALTGSGTDADADPLIYLWEQKDRGAGTGTGLLSQTKTNGPLFRVFGAYADVTDEAALEYVSPGQNLAGGDPTRTFPDMEQILAGTTNAKTGACPTPVDTDFVDNIPTVTSGTSTIANTLKNGPVLDCFSEWLPTADYVGSTQAGNTEPSINFRLTARDLHPASGGYQFADTKLTIDKTAGPFLVTSQGAKGASVVGGRTEAVAWSVANTATPALAENVRITLSTDGGETFPLVLAESTPNDGTHTVTWPNVGTDEARLKVEAVGNYFFDVNDAAFAITPSLIVRSSVGGDAAVQYSDAVTPAVVIDAQSGSVDSADLDAVATGLPEGLTLTQTESSAAGVLPGTSTWEVTGTVTDAPGTYPVTVTVGDGANADRTVPFTVEVSAEDAAVSFAGPATVPAPSGGDDAVDVPLRATVTDSAKLAGSADTTTGDISTATVTFTEAGTEDVLCEAPVVATGAGVGSAECTFSADLPASGDRSYDVTSTVGGHYTGATEKPATVDVVIDAEAPNTAITRGPADGSYLLARKTTFGYTSTEPGTFACALNARKRACSGSAVRLTNLPKRTNRFTVAGVDRVGNVDATPAVRTFTVPRGQASLTRVGRGWTTRSAGGAYLGTYATATRKGATLRQRITGATGIGVVVGKGKGHGSVTVYVGQRKLRVISLAAPSARGRQLVAIRFAAPVSGTVRIVSNSSKRVRIEGLGVTTP